MIIYIGIGNSDDKLTQWQWSRFVSRVDGAVAEHAVKTLGRWLSAPDAEWQNACWCIEILAGEPSDLLRDELADYAEYFNQESIAWAIADTHFIRPSSANTAEGKSR